jgi:2-iminobutanoate/2-iminopropanoate deaminase
MAEIRQFDPPRRYAAASRVGNVLYLAGETATDPITMATVPGGVEAQTEQVIANIRATLAHYGADLSDVFKLTLFLTDMSDLPAVSAIRSKHFPVPVPSSAIQVVALAAPDLCVEIEAIALIPSREARDADDAG